MSAGDGGICLMQFVGLLHLTNKSIFRPLRHIQIRHPDAESEGAAAQGFDDVVGPDFQLWEHQAGDQGVDKQEGGCHRGQDKKILR